LATTPTPSGRHIPVFADGHHAAPDGAKLFFGNFFHKYAALMALEQLQIRQLDLF
jgi:hypothetical protein